MSTMSCALQSMSIYQRQNEVMDLPLDFSKDKGHICMGLGSQLENLSGIYTKHSSGYIIFIYPRQIHSSYMPDLLALERLLDSFLTIPSPIELALILQYCSPDSERAALFSEFDGRYGGLLEDRHLCSEYHLPEGDFDQSVLNLHKAIFIFSPIRFSELEASYGQSGGRFSFLRKTQKFSIGDIYRFERQLIGSIDQSVSHEKAALGCLDIDEIFLNIMPRVRSGNTMDRCRTLAAMILDDRIEINCCAALISENHSSQYFETAARMLDTIQGKYQAAKKTAALQEKVDDAQLEIDSLKGANSALSSALAANAGTSVETLLDHYIGIEIVLRKLGFSVQADACKNTWIMELSPEALKAAYLSCKEYIDTMDENEALSELARLRQLQIEFMLNQPAPNALQALLSPYAGKSFCILDPTGDNDKWKMFLSEFAQASRVFVYCSGDQPVGTIKPADVFILNRPAIHYPLLKPLNASTPIVSEGSLIIPIRQSRRIRDVYVEALVQLVECRGIYSDTGV